MAGLNCGEANATTFPLLKARASCFIKCEDEITFKGMSRAKDPIGNDKLFSSGESGAVGLGFVEEVLSNDNYKDIILVIDTSGSMYGSKFQKAISDSKELINYVLADTNNRVAIITFSDESSIVSEFSNGKDTLLSKLDSLKVIDDTNYNIALKKCRHCNE